MGKAHLTVFVYLSPYSNTQLKFLVLFCYHHFYLWTISDLHFLLLHSFWGFLTVGLFVPFFRYKLSQSSRNLLTCLQLKGTPPHVKCYILEICFFIYSEGLDNSKFCLKSGSCFTLTIFVVHSDTSNGFWTLDPVMYAISTNSDFLDEKFFEFDILDETFRFKLSNLKYKIPLGNYRHKTPLFFTILHCKTTPFLIIVLQSTNTSIWQAANCPENVYGPTEKCSSAFKFH